MENEAIQLNGVILNMIRKKEDQLLRVRAGELSALIGRMGIVQVISRIERDIEQLKSVIAR